MVIYNRKNFFCTLRVHPTPSPGAHFRWSERRGPAPVGVAAAATAALVHVPRVRRRVRAGAGAVPPACGATPDEGARSIGVPEATAAAERRDCGGRSAAARERPQDDTILAAGSVHLPLGAKFQC